MPVSLKEGLRQIAEAPQAEGKTNSASRRWPRAERNQPTSRHGRPPFATPRQAPQAKPRHANSASAGDAQKVRRSRDLAQQKGPDREHRPRPKTAPAQRVQSAQCYGVQPLSNVAAVRSAASSVKPTQTTRRDRSRSHGATAQLSS